MEDFIASWLTGVQIGAGGDMVMDEYDIVDEKPEVAEIKPDDQSQETDPLASDCELSSVDESVVTANTKF